MIGTRPVEGAFRAQRWRATALLVGILFAVPWIRVGGNPLVLLDIEARRFHFGSLVLFPQELYFLWLLVLGLGVALFFFTSVAGRVWCGWACPQTVFTDIFAAVARRIEGWRGHQRPRHVAKWRTVALHAVLLLACSVISLHLVAYFRSPYQLVAEISAGEFTGPSFATWAIVTALAYVDFVFVRQTFCKYLCPYARFQSAMFDRNTLIVSYDVERGDPRGKRGAGDCVDCGLCVQVCPTGIDIRDGLQLGCITCTQCIDACNGVMERIDKPASLIGYRALDAPAVSGFKQLLRPRVIAYAGILATIVLVFAGLLVGRDTVYMQVERNRTELYHAAADGRIANSYTLHIQNRDQAERLYHLKLGQTEATASFELVAGVNPVSLSAGEEFEAHVFVLAPPDANANPAGLELQFIVEPVNDATTQVVRTARFLAPRSS